MSGTTADRDGAEGLSRRRLVHRRRSVVVVLGWTASLCLAGAAGYWAGRTTLVPPRVDAESSAETTYTVQIGTVGRTVTFPASATWPVASTVRSSAAGTITTVPLRTGDQLADGQVVFTVDMRPVIAATGIVPAYRDLSVGDEGPDVRQLQQLLVSLGFLTEAEADGHFDAATRRAVQRWQHSVAVTDDGTVRRADLLFVPHLPARVEVSDELSVGAPATPGMTAIEALGAVPTFSVELAAEQAATVPTSGKVDVVSADHTWPAQITDARTADGRLVLSLTGADGGAVCGDECGDVPAGGGSSVIHVELELTPAATGPTVPVSAIGTDPTGHTFVTTDSGVRIPVSVVSSDGGVAVVDGLAVGTTVQLFAPQGAASRTPDERETER